MAIENTVSNYSDLCSPIVLTYAADSINVFECRLPGVILVDAHNGICDNPRCQILPVAKGLILIVMKY